MIRKLIILLTFFIVIVTASCTKLDETFKGDQQDLATSGGTPNIDALLRGVYTSLHGTFQDQANFYALSEMSTDELLAPTRGPDWDDNGAWRVLHSHTWDGSNVHIRDVYNQLLGTVYSATDLLRFDSTSSKASEARFLRAFANYLVLDGWDQVPYRSPGESTISPSRVRKGTEALDYIISEINAVMPTLPAGLVIADVGKANQNAARVLLMKCYLNKGVYANRTAPTFDAADMQKVITLADELISSNAFEFSANYFDNFAPDNTNIGKENVWVQENISGVAYGGDGNTVRSRWHSTMHYKQKPGGWNGFSTLADFYNKFEAGDIRRGINYPTPGGPSNPGNRINVGFLVGQQYDYDNDTALTDRSGLPLIYTTEITPIEVGNNLEVTGIRAFKYPIDYPNDNSGNVDNDYVYFRLADALLMKAEAILRGGTGTVAGTYGSTALDIVNSVRADRGASALASVTLDNLIDERGRELYLENWRRQDLIRFGKFLEPFSGKPDASDPKYLLFAIPEGQLAGNPNLTPNPGYQ